MLWRQNDAIVTLHSVLSEASLLFQFSSFGGKEILLKKQLSSSSSHLLSLWLFCCAPITMPCLQGPHQRLRPSIQTGFLLSVCKILRRKILLKMLACQLYWQLVSLVFSTYVHPSVLSYSSIQYCINILQICSLPAKQRLPKLLPPFFSVSVKAPWVNTTVRMQYLQGDSMNTSIGKTSKMTPHSTS